MLFWGPVQLVCEVDGRAGPAVAAAVVAGVALRPFSDTATLAIKQDAAAVSVVLDGLLSAASLLQPAQDTKDIWGRLETSPRKGLPDKHLPVTLLRVSCRHPTLGPTSLSPSPRRHTHTP